MAGGEGTRLRPLTSNLPKPMMPLANRPMMEHIIDLLRRHGFDDIVVTVAFMPNAIRTYFGDGSEFGVRIVYATEETPLGTAGSVRNAGRRPRRALPRHLRRRAHRHRPRQDRRLPRGEVGAGHHRPRARREPARVRHRHHQRGRLHRALPREAHLGPGLQRHDQHRDLRAGAGDLRPHRRRPPGRLLVRGLPGAARGGPAPVRGGGRRLLGGRGHARGLRQRPQGHPRREGRRRRPRLRGVRRRVGGGGERDPPRRRHRRARRHRRQRPGRGRRPPGRVHRARRQREGPGRRRARPRARPRQRLPRRGGAPGRRRRRPGLRPPPWRPLRGRLGPRRRVLHRRGRRHRRRRQGVPVQDGRGRAPSSTRRSCGSPAAPAACSPAPA